MTKNTKILLLLSLFTTGLLVACGGPKSNNDRREPILSFRTTANDGSCEQPMKSFQGLQALCMYLIDEDRNDGCAQRERYDYFRANCIIDGRPVIEDVPEFVLNPNARPEGEQCDPDTDEDCEARTVQCNPATDENCEATTRQCNPATDADCPSPAADVRDTRSCEEGNEAACAVETGPARAAPVPADPVVEDESVRLPFSSYNSVFVPVSEDDIISFDNTTINNDIKTIELRVRYHSVAPTDFNQQLDQFRIAASTDANVLLSLDSLDGANISECQWEVSGNFILEGASPDNPAELIIRGEDPSATDYTSSYEHGPCENHALQIYNEVKNGSQLMLVIESLPVSEIDNLVLAPFTLQIGLDSSSPADVEINGSGAREVGVAE